MLEVCWNTRRCLPVPCLQKKDMTLIQIRFYPSNKETLLEVLHILDKQTEKTLSSLARLNQANETTIPNRNYESRVPSHSNPY